MIKNILKRIAKLIGTDVSKISYVGEKNDEYVVGVIDLDMLNPDDDRFWVVHKFLDVVNVYHEFSRESYEYKDAKEIYYNQLLNDMLEIRLEIFEG